MNANEWPYIRYDLNQKNGHVLKIHVTFPIFTYNDKNARSSEGAKFTSWEVFRRLQNNKHPTYQPWRFEDRSNQWEKSRYISVPNSSLLTSKKIQYMGTYMTIAMDNLWAMDKLSKKAYFLRFQWVYWKSDFKNVREVLGVKILIQYSLAHPLRNIRTEIS